MTRPHPYVYGAGTRLSSAYTAGRDGKPFARHMGARGSMSWYAWKAGRVEFLAARRAKS